MSKKCLPPFSKKDCPECGNRCRSVHSHGSLAYLYKCGFFCRLRHGVHFHKECVYCGINWKESTPENSRIEKLCIAGEFKNLKFYTAEISLEKTDQQAPENCDWCSTHKPKYWIPTVNVKKRRIEKECFICETCMKTYQEV